mgnify:CR=1 FL=1
MKIRLNTLSAVLAAAMLAAGAPAMADDMPHQPVAAVAQTRVSPEQAIATAQKQVGGQATDVQLQGKYGTPVYKVEVRNGTQEHTLYIDAASGQVLSSKVETEWKPVRQTAVSLERAIQIAQGKVQGRVIEAERDNSRGQVVYKVEILAANNVPHKVVVDANNGSVLASYVDYDD